MPPSVKFFAKRQEAIEALTECGHSREDAVELVDEFEDKRHNWRVCMTIAHALPDPSLTLDLPRDGLTIRTIDGHISNSLPRFFPYQFAMAVYSQHDRFDAMRAIARLVCEIMSRQPLPCFEPLEEVEAKDALYRLVEAQPDHPVVNTEGSVSWSIETSDDGPFVCVEAGDDIEESRSFRDFAIPSEFWGPVL